MICHLFSTWIEYHASTSPGDVFDLLNFSFSQMVQTGIVVAGSDFDATMLSVRLSGDQVGRLDHEFRLTCTLRLVGVEDDVNETILLHGESRIFRINFIHAGDPRQVQGNVQS